MIRSGSLRVPPGRLVVAVGIDEQVEVQLSGHEAALSLSRRRGRGDVVVVLDAELGEQLRTQPGERRVGLRAAGAEVDAGVVAYDAAVEHDHPVGQHDGLVDVVGDQQHGRPVPLAQLAEQRVHPDPGQRVEGAERLVGQQQLGVADQRAGQRGALLLAAGQLVGPGLLAAGEADLGQRLRPRSAASPVEAEHHVVEDALPRQQPGVLEDDRHLLGDLDETGAGDAAVEAGRGPAAACSCRAAATEQGHELTGRDVEVEAVEHAARLVEAAVQAADPHRRRRGLSSPVYVAMTVPSSR